MVAKNVDIQIHGKRRYKTFQANRNSEQENGLFQGHDTVHYRHRREQGENGVMFLQYIDIHVKDFMLLQSRRPQSEQLSQ
jgi:hypothetical protein